MMQSIHRHEAATMLASHGYEEILDDTIEGDEWRRYGKTRRLELLNEDHGSGGSNFSINPIVRLNKYYQVITQVCDCEDIANGIFWGYLIS
jgi:hypothetical protein